MMLSRSIGRAAAAILSLAALGCGSSSAPSTPSNPATETYAASLGIDITQMTKLSNDLYYKDSVVGTGVSAAAGSFISTYYTLYLVDGTKLETNVGSGTPIQFTLGTGAVIPGWDQGIVGMKVGGTRRLVIGSALAYGPSGQGSVPPNATLIFDVQLTASK